MKTLLLAEIEDCRLHSSDGETIFAFHCPFLSRAETNSKQSFECNFPGSGREYFFSIDSQITIDEMYHTFHKKCPLLKVVEYEETTDS